MREDLLITPATPQRGPNSSQNAPDAPGAPKVPEGRTGPFEKNPSTASALVLGRMVNYLMKRRGVMRERDDDAASRKKFEDFKTNIQPHLNDMLFNCLLKEEYRNLEQFFIFQNQMIDMLVAELNKKEVENIVVILKGGNLHKFYILEFLKNLPDSEFKDIVRDLASAPSDVDVECIFTTQTTSEQLKGLAEMVFQACRTIRTKIEKDFFEVDEEMVKTCIKTKSKPIIQYISTQRNSNVDAADVVQLSAGNDMYIAPQVTLKNGSEQKHKLYVQSNESIFNEESIELFKLVRIKRAFQVWISPDKPITKGAEVLDVGIPANDEANTHYEGNYEPHEDTKFQRFTLGYVVQELAMIIFNEQIDQKFEKRAYRFVTLYAYYCISEGMTANVTEALDTLTNVSTVQAVYAKRNTTETASSAKYTVFSNIATLMRMSENSEEMRKFRKVLDKCKQANEKPGGKINRFYSYWRHRP